MIKWSLETHSGECAEVQRAKRNVAVDYALEVSHENRDFWEVPGGTPCSKFRLCFTHVHVI